MRLKKEFIVGIVSLVGICGLIYGSFFLKGQELWKDRSTYFGVYYNSEGLTTGRPITLNGLKIGTIVDIYFKPNNLSKIVVEMEISDVNAQKIPLGSIAKLNSDLIAGPYIEILWKDSSIYYQAGDTLASDISMDLQAQINERLLPLEKKTNELISTADSAIKTIEAIFSRNTDNLDESFEGIRRAISNFERVSLRLDTLIKSEKYKISRVLSNIEEITKNLKESNDDIKNMFSNLSDFSDSLALVDLAGAISKAKDVIDQVSIVVDDIQNGDGTLTKLLQDSLMYNNVNLMLDEATRLIENIKTHPNRYLQFSVFGSKERGALDVRDEKILKKFVNDSLNRGN